MNIRNVPRVNINICTSPNRIYFVYLFRWRLLVFVVYFVWCVFVCCLSQSLPLSIYFSSSSFVSHTTRITYRGTVRLYISRYVYDYVIICVEHWLSSITQSVKIFVCVSCSLSSEYTRNISHMRQVIFIENNRMNGRTDCCTYSESPQYEWTRISCVRMNIQRTISFIS